MFTNSMNVSRFLLSQLSYKTPIAPMASRFRFGKLAEGTTLEEIDPRIAGGTIQVSEKIKPLFSFGEYNVNNEAQINFRNSALGQSVSNLHNQAMKYRDDNTQIPTIQSLDVINESL